MLNFLRTRRREPEWMDEPDASPQELRESLAYIRKVNRVMGYVSVVLDQLERFSAGWKAGESITILDVATGSADIPAAVLRWADARKFKVRVIGVDLSAQTAREAARVADADPRLRIVRANALQLPFADGSFDYALTSMFLHHLGDAEARQALAEMGRVSRRGVVASDLLRLPHAYAFIWLMTCFSSPMIKHDARVSIRQAFTRREILQLRDGAGLDFARYFTHLGHRFVLAGEREPNTARLG